MVTDYCPGCGNVVPQLTEATASLGALQTRLDNLRAAAAALVGFAQHHPVCTALNARVECEDPINETDCDCGLASAIKVAAGGITDVR